MQLHALCSTNAARRGAMRFQVLLIFDLDFIKLGIATIRVMMKHHQGTNFRIGRQLPHLRYQRMTPAMLVGHIVLGILRIVDQHVDTMQIFHPLVVGGSQSTRGIEFVVGYVGTGNVVIEDLVGNAATGVIQCLADHTRAFAFVKLAFNTFEFTDSIGRKLFCPDREIRTVHLLEQRT